MIDGTITKSDSFGLFGLEKLINEREAANFLGYSVRALQNWRFRGGGPKFVKVSQRSIRYRRKDLIQWAEDNIVSNTSEH
jgi:predicted DNA-binding transcriptional regulator AlpA